MFNVFNGGTISAYTNALNLSKEDKKRLEKEKESLRNINWNDIKDDKEKLQKVLDEQGQNSIFKFNLGSMMDFFESTSITKENVEARLKELKEQAAQKQQQKDGTKGKQNSQAANNENKANGGAQVASSRSAQGGQKAEAPKSQDVKSGNGKSQGAQFASNPFGTTGQTATVKSQMLSATGLGSNDYDDEENGGGVFREGEKDRQRAIMSGKFDKNDYKGGGGVHGARYKGIKIAAAAEGYIGFIDGRKNSTENSLAKARKEQKTTRKERNLRQRAPKTKNIAENAGNIEDLQNTTKGQATAAVGSAKAAVSSPKVQTAQHSQGASSAMGKVGGAVDSIKRDFKQDNNSQNCQNFQNIMSGVDGSKQKEDGGLRAFDGAKTAASSLEAQQEMNAKSGDQAVEKAMESSSDKEVAAEQINDAQSQMESANQLTAEGNADIDEGMAAIKEAEDLAGEAEALAGESNKLQKEGLKKLQKSNQQMQRGVNLTKKGDKLTGVGQALIHSGVPLTYSIFTVGIGVAMISTGLGLAAKGKAKQSAGNSQVRQGKTSRKDGMKKFDNGTKKANEAKEKQTEAEEKNEEATSLSEQGTTKIKTAVTQRTSAEKQKAEGESKYTQASVEVQQYTSASISCAQESERMGNLIQNEVDKSKQALGTILSAKEDAEKLTGLQGQNNQVNGNGKAEDSNINPDEKSANSSSGNKGPGGLAQESGYDFNLSNGMKNIGYKKSLNKDKAKDKKNEKTNNQKNQAQANNLSKPNGTQSSKSSIFTASQSAKIIKPVSIFAKG